MNDNNTHHVGAILTLRCPNGHAVGRLWRPTNATNEQLLYESVGDKFRPWPSVGADSGGRWETQCPDGCGTFGGKVDAIRGSITRLAAGPANDGRDYALS